MDPLELLQAIALHFETSGGTSLNATSPLIVAAREALATTPANEPRRSLLPVRAGLTPEERERRRKTLGSSEIAAVCGINPYDSVHSVWLSKCRGVDFEGNEATVLGNLLEPTIFAIYADRYGRELVKGEYTTGPEPWMSATPDARIVGGGIVEAKLVGLRSLWMWGPGNSDEQESDAVPLHYLAQAQWQMAVTREPFVDVSALLGTEFRTYRVRSSESLQAQLVERGRDFWQRYVMTGQSPPVDGSEGARAMLKSLYPRAGAEVVEADAELEELARRLAESRAVVAHTNAVYRATFGGSSPMSDHAWSIVIRRSRGRYPVANPIGITCDSSLSNSPRRRATRSSIRSAVSSFEMVYAFAPSSRRVAMYSSTFEAVTFTSGRSAPSTRATCEIFVA